MTVEYLHSSILNSSFASTNHSTAPLVLQFTSPRLHEMFRIWKFKFSYKFLIVFSKNHLTNLAFYSIIYFVAEENTSSEQSDKCDSGVVGNARPCQGRDRGFEPRLSLSEHHLKLMLFSFPSMTFHNYSNPISANNIYIQYPWVKRIFAIRFATRLYTE